jgi:hypothetical protein
MSGRDRRGPSATKRVARLSRPASIREQRVWRAAALAAALALAVLLFAPGTALALSGGPEIAVNTTTARGGLWPAIANEPDGGFTVAWTSDDGSSWGVYARRFDAAGAPLGGEVAVNTTTAGTQGSYGPAIAAEPDGGFTVAWSSSDGQDGSGWGVYARRFDAAGEPLGGEIAVNTTTADDQYWPAIAADPGGGFTVAWMSEEQHPYTYYAIYTRRFDAAGAPLSGEILVSEAPPSGGPAPYAITPGIAPDDHGGFTVAWTGDRQDGSGLDVYARRFDATGAPLGGEVAVNTTTAGDQGYPYGPAIAAEPGGGFSVAWTSDGQDGSGYGVYARRLDSTGAPLGGEVAVNTTTAGDQGSYGPAIAAEPGGGFTVAWESDGQDGSGYGVYARFFDATGAPLTGEVAVNTTTAENQWQPAIAPGGEGGLTAAWASYPFPGVYARLFADTPDTRVDSGPAGPTNDPTPTDPSPASRRSRSTAAAPVRGKTVNVEPVKGVVRVREPGARRFHRLRFREQIRVRSRVDARRGRVRLTSAARSGKTQTADFYRGVFQVRQRAKGRPTIELRLLAMRSRTRRGHRGRGGGSGLWGNGHGDYTTHGKYGSATVRGTIWFTQDLPTGTYFKVRRGVVVVRDFTRHRKLKLHPGQHYLAPAR